MKKSKTKTIAHKEIPLTLNHNLVTGNQYLLAIARLCILEYCGPGMGCCCIGHGERREALDSICTIISQLDGPSLCDCNCAFNGMDGEEKGGSQSRRHLSFKNGHLRVHLLYCPLLVW